MYLAHIEYGSIPFLVIVAVIYMPAPAYAVIIIQKLIYKEPLAVYGLTLKNIQAKHFLLAPVFYLVFVLLTLALILILGNLFHFGGFGEISFRQDDVMGKIAELARGRFNISQQKIPPPILLFILGLFGGIFSGAIINLPFTLGEELGWRGLLFKEIQSLGFWRSNLLIGTIWGVWHAPIILMGHNYPHYPVIGSLMMIPFCISISFLQSVLRLRCNSVFAPAIFHGMLNAGGPLTVLYVINNNELIGSIVGAAGISAALIVTGIYLLKDKKFISQYKDL